MSLVQLARMRTSRHHPRPHRDHPDTIFNERQPCLSDPTFLEFLLKRFRSALRSHVGNIVCPSVSYRRRSRSQNRTDTSFHCPLPNPENRWGFLSKRRSAGEPTSPNLSNALDSHRPSLELQLPALAPWLLYACDRYPPVPSRCCN
jgi:hypothetical protein